MIDAVHRTLNRILNRHPYSDTLTRPAFNDSVRMVSSGCRKRSIPPTDSTEDPKIQDARLILYWYLGTAYYEGGGECLRLEK
jgi:hypothetical protein